MRGGGRPAAARPAQGLLRGRARAFDLVAGGPWDLEQVAVDQAGDHRARDGEHDEEPQLAERPAAYEEGGRQADGQRRAVKNKKGARTGAPKGLVAGAGFEPATFGL